MGSYDKIFVNEFVTGGCFFPQKSIPNINLSTLSNTIGKSLYNEGVHGYISVDLITFPDSSIKLTGKSNNERLFWAVDLNCYLTSFPCVTYFFDFLMSGRLDSVSGIYTVKKQDLANPQPTSSTKCISHSFSIQDYIHCIIKLSSTFAE